MATLIYEEIELFRVCMLLGASLAFVYDLVRIFRLLFAHRAWVVDVEDLVFWIATAWLVFRTLFTYNQGMLRAYAFFGLFLGCLLYALSISRLLMKGANRLVPYWNRGKRYIRKPIDFLWGTIRKGLKNIKAQVKMAIKSR